MSVIEANFSVDRASMSKWIFRSVLAGMLAMAGAMTGCLGDRVDGGGSETTLTGVAGKVVDESGHPIAGAVVRIRPEGALPPGLLGLNAAVEEGPAQAITGADGTFLIQDIAPGDYFVDCRGSAGAALVTARVGDSLVRLPDAKLQPTGAVRGWIAKPSPQTYMLTAYVYIPGLPGRTMARIQDQDVDTLRFVLGDIPAGEYLLRVQPAFPMELSTLNILEVPGVRILPGDTLELDSLVMPVRSLIQDPAYARDSSSLREILRANLPVEWDSGGLDVRQFSAVAGNRIAMFYNFHGWMTRLTPEIGNLDRLEVIYLMTLPSLGATLEAAPEIGRLRGLKRLWLEGYRLDGLPAWAGNFHELASLMLASAGLKDFPERIVDFSFLVALDLEGNSIARLPASLGRLGRLRVLDMSGNELTSLPPELLRMESLQGVRLRGNRLCNLSDEWKAWVSRQDSLWIKQADPLSYFVPGVDSGWEASQRCGTP